MFCYYYHYYHQLHFNVKIFSTKVLVERTTIKLWIDKTGNYQIEGEIGDFSSKEKIKICDVVVDPKS